MLNLKNERYLLILSILLYSIIGILTIFISENISNFEWDKEPLYDIIHANYPIYPPPDIPTYFVVFYFLYTLVRWGPIDLRIIALYLMSTSLILAYRILTFSLTQTPPPKLEGDDSQNHHCKRNMFSHIGINFEKASGTCVDNMFSGHATHIVCAITILFLFSKSIIEKLVLSLVGIVALVTIITSRLHYTSDVLIAIIISVLSVTSLNEYMFTP
jgi:hypothetical protein